MIIININNNLLIFIIIAGGGDIFLSPIIGYANDMNKKEKQCPPLVCRYIKSDWRTLMIMCQSCDTWYHSMCVHLVNNKVRDMTEFMCPSCKKISNTLNN